MKFDRISDDDLRKNGWDPALILDDPEREGPYAVTELVNEPCHQCGMPTQGWTVLDLTTGTGVGAIWTHDNGEEDAHEEANSLNNAWLNGYAAGQRRTAA